MNQDETYYQNWLDARRASIPEEEWEKFQGDREGKKDLYRHARKYAALKHARAMYQGEICATPGCGSSVSSKGYLHHLYDACYFRERLSDVHILCKWCHDHVHGWDFREELRKELRKAAELDFQSSKQLESPQTVDSSQKHPKGITHMSRTKVQECRLAAMKAMRRLPASPTLRRNLQLTLVSAISQQNSIKSPEKMVGFMLSWLLKNGWLRITNGKTYHQEVEVASEMQQMNDSQLEELSLLAAQGVHLGKNDGSAAQNEGLLLKHGLDVTVFRQRCEHNARLMREFRKKPKIGRDALAPATIAKHVVSQNDLVKMIKSTISRDQVKRDILAAQEQARQEIVREVMSEMGL